MNRIREIFNHYGLKHQLEKGCEETQELTNALFGLFYLVAAYKGPDKEEHMARARKNLAEEIADVRIMCDQIEYGLGLEQECQEQREFKINRQLKRIEIEREISQIAEGEAKDAMAESR